jgi:hypothetical protein
MGHSWAAAQLLAIASNTNWRSPMKVLGTILVFACSILIYAQVPATVGSITGTVQDEAGNVIPGVTVTAVGPTGRVSAVSDTQGAYTLSSVPPGTYAVSAFLQGFAETRFIDIEVRSGATIRLGFTLRVQPRLQFQMPVPPPRDRNLSIVADSQTAQGNTIFYRGHVRLFSDAMELTADELDFDRLSRTFDVRGNVRVRLLPLTVRTVPLSSDR